MKKELVGRIGKSILVHVHLCDLPDGTFAARCLEIPACSVTAATEQEVTDLIKEAIEASLSLLLSHEVIEHALRIMTA